MSTIIILVIFFFAGFAIGAWVSRKPPLINNPKIEANLVIDKTALDGIEQARVIAWLEVRGLTWMPKGATFDPKRKVKK